MVAPSFLGVHMKVSNFELIEVKRVSVGTVMYIAEIDVTKGIFKKNTERKVVCRETCGSWFWQDTGKFTPSFEVEKLARIYTSKTGKEC
jgi:hypothetical protein